MASSSPDSDWECGACTFLNKGGKYCTMCGAARTKRQAVAAAPVPVVAAVSECAPAASKHHPRGIILEVVGTASPDRGRSCKEHACCGCKVLTDNVVVCLRREQILMPDHISEKGQ